MFRDPEYVKWANESTIHVIAYGLDKNANGPEPVLRVKRGAEDTEVLARYPMFTASEAEDLVNESYASLKFSLHTPWVGVVALDGTTVLASGAKGGASQYREMYEAEQRKLGPVVAHDVWKKVRRLLDASSEADFDGKWAEAVKAALEAKAAVLGPPKVLAEKIAARVEALETTGRAHLEAAARIPDPQAREAAVAKVKADFAGLSFLAAK